MNAKFNQAVLYVKIVKKEWIFAWDFMFLGNFAKFVFNNLQNISLASISERYRIRFFHSLKKVAFLFQENGVWTCLVKNVNAHIIPSNSINF